MGEPLLATLGSCGEVSGLMISPLEDMKLLHKALEHGVRDKHLCLPCEPQSVEARVKELSERTGRISGHYDGIRLAPK